MSGIVKCTSCNLVVNEVLSFICNKLDVMDEVSLGRICVTAFSEEEIVNAKTLLFESLSATDRMKTRRKKGKSARDIDDIICFLKETDPEALPIFVARDLQKLPPVLFDHVDVTRLLKDLLILRKDIENIKEDYATVNQVESLRSEVDTLKKGYEFGSTSKVNRKRGACLMESFEYNSGPAGLPPGLMNNDSITKQQCSQEDKILPSQNSPLTFSVVGTPQSNNAVNLHPPALVSQTSTESADVCPKPSECVQRSRDDAKSQPVARVGVRVQRESSECGSIPTVQLSSEPKQLFSEAVRSKKVENDTHKEWITVQNRRRRNCFIGNIGQAVSESNAFKSADIKVPLYIYNVSKETSSDDISSYIKMKIDVSFSLEKMSMKVPKEYDAYKVFVPKHKQSVFLRDDFWPEGVSYRRFVVFKPRNINGSSVATKTIP